MPTATVTPPATNTVPAGTPTSAATSLPSGCAPATPTYTLSPTPTYTLTPLPVGSATSVPLGTNTPTYTPSATVTPQHASTMKIDPATISSPPDSDLILYVIQNAPVVTTGAQLDLRFDRTKLEIKSIEAGAPYAAAQLFMGLADSAGTRPPVEDVLAYANDCTGVIRNLSLYLAPGTGEVASGEQQALKLNFRTLDQEGASDVEILSPKLTNADDEQGAAFGITATKGTVTVDVNAPTPTPTIPATVVGTPTVLLGSPTVLSTVAGTGAAPATGSTATGLPNAGAWLGEDNTRSLILGISGITLVVSLIALANTWIRRRGF